MKVYFTNLRHGKPPHNYIIYGELRDASTGQLIYSDSLSFLLVAIEERGYIVVSGKERNSDMQVIDKDQFETVARVVAKCNKYIVKSGETWKEVYNQMMALASLEMYTYNHLSVSGFVLSAWDSPDGRRHVSASINSSIMKDFFSLGF